jgi:dihydrofolate synthase / folylpolyglutamate synthase
LSKNFGSTDEAFDFVASFINFERSKKQTIRDYRLDRMRELLKHFGNPEKAFKTIHLAGSKGKGSTAMFLASALNSAGKKTGLYSSPHISDYRERISLGGVFFENKIYIQAASEIKNGIKTFILEDETGSSEPTAFELLTLMAFMIFKKTSCIYAIIETGIGGRLDATNVITPEASVITHIEMEHADILGDSIEKIASEKAGIIKTKVPVFTGDLEQISAKIVKEKAELMEAPLIILASQVKINKVSVKLEGTEVLFYIKNKEYHFNLRTIGKVQAENALLAWLVLLDLLKPDGDIEKNLIKGINNSQLPGRFEITRKNEDTFVFDGAHTPVSIKRLLESWNSIFNRKGILIFGSVADKNPEEMAKILAPHFEKIIISTPGTFKESYPEKVYELFKKYSQDVHLEKDPIKAYKKALGFSKKEKPILVTGSFYMISEIRKLTVK